MDDTGPGPSEPAAGDAADSTPPPPPPPPPAGAAPPEGPTSATPAAARAAIDNAITWARGTGRETVITMAIAFGVAWLANVYIIAVRYEGVYTAPGGAATTSGNWLAGSLFWLVLSTLVLTVITYARKVGPSRLVSELRVLPSNLTAAFSSSGAPWASLLWGAALSLVIAIVFGHAMAGITGVLLLVLAASPLVGFLAKGLRTAGQKVFSLALGERAAPLAQGGAVATLLGTAAGMAIAWQVRSDLVKLVLAALAIGGVFFLLARRDISPPAAAATILLGLALGLVLRDLLAAVAFADDGGWQEGGGTFTSWIRSAGAGKVMMSSTVGAVTSAGGSVAGAAAGNTLASSAANSGLGGLSGEWGASADGATVTTPAEPMAPTPVPAMPMDTDGPATTGGDTTGTGGAPEVGAGTAGTGGSGGAPDPGAGTAGSETAGTGGLSGEWSGGSQPPPDAPPRTGGPAVPPPPMLDDEDEA